MLFEAPEQVRQIKELGILYDMTDTIGQQLMSEMERLKQNQFLATATKESIEAYEQMLGITKDEKDTLESRRFRVQSKVYQTLPYTTQILRKMLNALCGEKNYKLEVNFEKGMLTCLISEKYKKHFQDIVNLLDNIVPLNLFVNVIVHFVSDGMLYFGGKQKMIGKIIVTPYTEKEYRDTGKVYTGALASNVVYSTRILQKGE